MKEQYKDMNSYITQGTTITVQTAVLKETLEDNKDILNNEKELMIWLWENPLIQMWDESSLDKDLFLKNIFSIFVYIKL